MTPADLFPADPATNLLPADGAAFYHGSILSEVDARRFFQNLWDTVPWKNDESFIFGKHIVTARKVAWYGDGAFDYTYSRTTKTALVWTPELLALKTLVEARSAARFNSCLLNLYHDGREGMGWHSDDEKSLEPDAPIASISLGADRKFSLRHKRTGETVSLVLADGSLLVMRGTTQTHWQHCVPKSKKITTPRINLTFRTMRDR